MNVYKLLPLLQREFDPKETMLVLTYNDGIYEVSEIGNGTPVNFQLQNSIPTVQPAFRKPKFHK